MDREDTENRVEKLEFDYKRAVAVVEEQAKRIDELERNTLECLNTISKAGTLNIEVMKEQAKSIARLERVVLHLAHNTPNGIDNEDVFNISWASCKHEEVTDG